MDITGGEPQLRLLDANGKARTALGLRQDVPGLSIFDADETPRAVLEMNENGPRLVLRDELERPVVILGVTDDASTLSLGNHDSGPTFDLSVKDSEAGLVFREILDERPQVVLGLTKDGSKLALGDSEMVLGVTEHGPSVFLGNLDAKAELRLSPNPELTLSDIEGHQRLRLDLQAGTTVGLQDEEQKGQLFLTVFGGEPRMEMKDSAGEVFWKAP